MATTKRTIIAGLVLALGPPALAAESRPHRLALQVSDNDPEKMNAARNVAANVSRHYSDKGEEIEIQIVAFNAGLNLLRDDTSPVKDRLAAFMKSMPNVAWKAGWTTIDAMSRREGEPAPIVAGADIVPAGVVTLSERGEAGWTIARP